MHQEIRKFLEYLEIEKGKSLKTVENYQRYLLAFQKFGKLKEVGEITDDTVRKFRLYLKRKNLKKNSQNYYLIALRSFLKYLARQGVECYPAERIELAKTGERDLDLISNEELTRLLQSPNLKNAQGLRDKAILELLFSTGLRVSELCSLETDNIDLKKDEFSVRGKGAKIRLVFLSSEAKKALKNYLDKRELMDKEKLFVITPRQIERVIKKYAIKAGITRKVTPHVLRHSFATDLLQNGADIRSVQKLLGHSSVQTTQVYTHVTDSELKAVHQHFHRKKI